MTHKTIEKKPTSPEYPWAHLSDEVLLQVRLCELNLELQGSDVAPRVHQLYQELASRKILFLPLCYFADEWFVPSNDTVIGIPFYLAHPRLKRLEKKIMLEVEGGDVRWCMQLLRHEAGHAVYNAYGFRRKKKIWQLFGPPSNETPETYKPKPHSRNYVQNLPDSYSQCDPDEDFAETFAVWLNPYENWRKKYKGWKVMEKLEYVDELMKTIVDKPPLKTTHDFPFGTAKSKSKLSTYYQKKRKLFEEDYPDFFDVDLLKIFSKELNAGYGELAHRFIKRHQKQIVSTVACWTEEKKYTINDLLKSFEERCKELALRLQKTEEGTILDLCTYLTAMISNYHYTGRFKRKR